MFVNSDDSKDPADVSLNVFDRLAHPEVARCWRSSWTARDPRSTCVRNTKTKSQVFYFRYEPSRADDSVLENFSLSPLISCFLLSLPPSLPPSPLSVTLSIYYVYRSLSFPKRHFSLNRCPPQTHGVATVVDRSYDLLTRLFCQIEFRSR